MKYIFLILKVFFLILAINFFKNINLDNYNFFDINLIYSLVLLFFFHLLRVWRTLIILKVLKFPKFTFRIVFDIYYIGLAAGILTPGRSGEIYRFKILNDHNVKFMKSIKYFFYEKVTDFFSLIFLFKMLLIISFLETKNINTIILIFFLFLSLIITPFIMKKMSSLHFLFKKKINKRNFNQLLSYDLKKYFLIIVLTTLIWQLFVYALSIAIYGINNFDATNINYIFIINSFSNILPISFMGIGVREYLISFLLPSNTDEFIFDVSINLILFYAFSVIIGTITFLLREINEKK